MAQITEIIVRANNPEGGTGLKGQMFEETLSGVDLFIGPNGSGKTTRLIAPILAMLGLAGTATDPRKVYLQEKPVGTDVVLNVMVNGIKKQLIRDLSDTRGKAFTEANTNAISLLGKAPVAWNLQDFSAATDGARSKIMDLITRTGSEIERWDAERAQEHLTGKVLNPTLLDELIATMPGKGMDGADWLKHAAIWTGKKYSELNAAQRQAKAYAEEVGSKKWEDAKWSPLDDQALSDLRDQLSQARDQKGRALRVKGEITRHEAEIARKKTEIENYKKQIEDNKKRGRELRQPVEFKPDDISAYEDELEAARELQSKPITAQGPDIPTLQQEELRLKKRLEASSANLEKLQGEFKKAYRRHKGQVERRDRLQSEISMLESGYLDLVCVHCKRKDPTGQGQKIEELNKKLRAAEKEIDSPALDKLATEASELEVAVGILEATHRSAAEALKVALASNPQEEEITERKQRLNAAERAHRQAKAMLQRMAREHAEREEERKAEFKRSYFEYQALQRSLTNATKGLKALEETAMPEMPKEVLTQDLATKIREMEARNKRFMAASLHVVNVRDAVKKMDESAAAFATCKELKKEIANAQKALAEAAYLPINNAAQSLLTDAEKLPTPFFRGPNDFGAIIRGRETQYYDLSESEQRITAAALVYALSFVSGQACKLVLLDGVEVVQRDLRAPLMRALAKAQAAGHVDNVIMTMADEIEDIEGVEIHRLEIVETVECQTNPLPSTDEPNAQAQFGPGAYSYERTGFLEPIPEEIAEEPEDEDDNPYGPMPF